MNPRNKFLLGAGIIVASVVFLIASGVKETGVYFLTPTELFHYVRATQRLAAWAESLREAAVGRYCTAPPGGDVPAGGSVPPGG
jgi:hypothetical protein